MVRISRNHLIALAAIPLSVVLVSVGLVAFKGRTPEAMDPAPVGGGVDPAAGDPEPEPGRPKLAVTPEQFDAMGKLLDGLGEGYRYQTIEERAIREPGSRNRFDVIFLTCSESEGGAPGPALETGLRDFVTAGGTLYASDLRFDALAAAFPEFVNLPSVAQGVRQDVRASVVTPELRDVVGDEITLHFGLDGWRPAAFRGEDVTVLLKGKLRTTAGVTIEGPLLVKITLGKGTIFFTSFHNEKRNSPSETRLLRYLAMKTTAAGLEYREVNAMAGEGFSPQAVSLLDVEPGAAPTTRTFDHPKAGPIQFRLGFEGSGARMRLEVVSPKGQRTVKRGESTLSIDVPDAAPGRWQYLATSEQAPYPGFASLLMVGTPEVPDSPADGKVNPALTATGGNVRFEEISLGNQPAVAVRPPRIAVSEASYDDMGKLLLKLGNGYQYQTVTMEDLLRPDALAGFDLYFLTCSGWPGPWALSNDGKSDREGLSVGRVNPAKKKRSGAVLARFVAQGGTLYASDLRVQPMIVAFPDREPPLYLNERVLPELIEAEREWLRQKAPAARLETVNETLRGAGLGPALASQMDRLVTGVESSPLVLGGLNEPGARPDQIVQDVLRDIGLPADPADVRAIARALVAWEASIVEAYRARSRASIAKSTMLISRAERRLAECRDGIVQNPRGRKDQLVSAKVVNPGLREVLGGDSLPLNFNTNGWEPARFRGDDVTILLRGEYLSLQGAQAEAPLLVKFPHGQGTVIFTSFHNEAQNNQQEEALLRYLVFSAVTAKEEARTDKTMLSGGFSPVKRSQISHSAGNDSVTRIYTSPGPGPLRFALAFTGTGARLRLTLIAPNGQRYTNEVKSTLVVQATGAPAGDWSYKVESLQVPYENFPFSVSIGKGDDLAARP